METVVYTDFLLLPYPVVVIHFFQEKKANRDILGENMHVIFCLSLPV